MAANGRLGPSVRAKDGRLKCLSTELKSVWLSTTAIDCICKSALRSARRKKRKQNDNKKRSRKQCVSKFRTQRAISPFPCLFYSKCHSIAESAFRALLQRCRCTQLNIYHSSQMGWVFTRAQGGGSGFLKITQRPSTTNSKLFFFFWVHSEPKHTRRTPSDLV